MIRFDHVKLAIVSASAAVFLGIGVRAEQQAPAPPARSETAAQHYKNIQVLKDIPANQLPNAMQYVAASLGVQCNFCHVQGQFDSDEKPMKATARKMMQMVHGINAASYGITVSCATCHHGHMAPERTPPLAAELTPEQAARVARQTPQRGAEPPRAQQPGAAPEAGGRGQRPAESVDDVLDKYVQALGGRDAWSNATTVVMEGKQTSRDLRTAPVKIEEKITGEYRIDVESPQGAASRVSDGKTAWFVAGGNTRPLEGIQAEQAARLADVALPLNAKQKYSKLAVERYAALDGTDTIVVTGTTASDVTEQLFFDRHSGLLVRRSIATPTPLGPLSEQIDYSDYREVSGVKLPFRVRYATWNQANTLEFSDVQLNVPLDDTLFRK
ncbi:MAG TPA: c-type cytochrome [Vicinamibacterales bacterium]|nr:c-type cytochrome [Vicinamibacterales bacterium]